MLRSRTWLAPPPLGRHVAAIWRLTGPGAELGDDWLLPATAVDVAIHLGDPAQIADPRGEIIAPRRVVAGGLARARLLRHGGATDVVGVRLIPGCACLLDVPAAALHDVIAPLDAVAPRLDRALAGWEPRLDTLVAILAAHLRPRCDAVAVRAAGRLAALDGPSVRALADEVGLSRRQLTRRFAAQVGMTPREFVRIARFQRAWERAALAPARWAEIAADAGYADQPHLDREFRLRVGLAPTRVFPPTWHQHVEITAPVSPPFKPGDATLR